MEVGGLFAVPTWHLFIRRNPGFILFIMPLWGPKGMVAGEEEEAEAVLAVARISHRAGGKSKLRAAAEKF